jgi:hypothetical protein
MAANDLVEVRSGQGGGWSAESRCQCSIHARDIRGYNHGRISEAEVYMEPSAFTYEIDKMHAFRYLATARSASGPDFPIMDFRSTF